MNAIRFFIYALILSNATIIIGSHAAKKADSDTSAPLAWVQAKMKLFPKILESLPEEDRQVWNKGINYAQNPEAVTRSRRNYVTELVRQVQQSGSELEYDEETIQSAVLQSVIARHTKTVKVVDEQSARSFAFTQLSEDEQATWRRPNYQACPEKAHQVAQKWSVLAAATCTQYKFIKPEEAEQTAKKLYEEKLETFKTMYSKPESTTLKEATTNQ